MDVRRWLRQPLVFQTDEDRLLSSQIFEGHAVFRWRLLQTQRRLAAVAVWATYYDYDESRYRGAVANETADDNDSFWTRHRCHYLQIRRLHLGPR